MQPEDLGIEEEIEIDVTEELRHLRDEHARLASLYAESAEKRMDVYVYSDQYMDMADLHSHTAAYLGLILGSVESGEAG